MPTPEASSATTTNHPMRTNCPICARTPGMKRAKHRNFWGHLREVHNMSPDQFRTEYPKVKVHDHDESETPVTASTPVRRTTRKSEPNNTVLTIEAPDDLPPMETSVKPETQKSQKANPVSRRKTPTDEQRHRTIRSIITHMEREKPRLQRVSSRSTLILERAMNAMRKEVTPV